MDLRERCAEARRMIAQTRIKRYPDELKREVLARIDTRADIMRAATELGLPHSTLYGWWTQAHPQPVNDFALFERIEVLRNAIAQTQRTRPRQGFRYSDGLRRRAVNLATAWLAQGGNVGELGNRLGLGQGTLHAWIRKKRSSKPSRPSKPSKPSVTSEVPLTQAQARDLLTQLIAQFPEQIAAISGQSAVKCLDRRLDRIQSSDYDELWVYAESDEDISVRVWSKASSWTGCIQLVYYPDSGGEGDMVQLYTAPHSSAQAAAAAAGNILMQLKGEIGKWKK